MGVCVWGGGGVGGGAGGKWEGMFVFIFSFPKFSDTQYLPKTHSYV